MADTNDWRPRANPWLIAGAVMAATIMELLDTQQTFQAVSQR